MNLRSLWVLLFALLLVVSSQAHSQTQGELKGMIEGYDIELSKKEKETLDIGDLSMGGYILGGVIGTYPLGFGLGHAIQGRWTSKGWIFTTGEVVSLIALVVGASDCIGDSIFADTECTDESKFLTGVGLYGFVGFRLWEIFDVWFGGYNHRVDYQNLKDRIRKEAQIKKQKTSLLLKPMIERDGAGLSLSLTF